MTAMRAKSLLTRLTEAVMRGEQVEQQSNQLWLEKVGTLMLKGCMMVFHQDSVLQLQTRPQVPLPSTLQPAMCVLTPLFLLSPLSRRQRQNETNRHRQLSICIRRRIVLLRAVLPSK